MLLAFVTLVNVIAGAVTREVHPLNIETVEVAPLVSIVTVVKDVHPLKKLLQFVMPEELVISASTKLVH